MVCLNIPAMFLNKGIILKFNFLNFKKSYKFN